MTFHRILLLSVLFPAIICSTLHAQETTQPRIESFLTDTAIGYARVRLDDLDATSLLTFVDESLELKGDVRSQIGSLLMTVNVLRSQLMASGVTDIYLVVELEHFLQGPYVLIDFKPDSNPEIVQNTVRAAIALGKIPYEQKLVEYKGMLFAGNEKILEHLKAGHLGVRPSLAQASEKVATSPLQIVICPSTDQSRAIREGLPTFPAPFDNIDGDLISSGIRSIAASFDITPQPKLQVFVDSSDEQSARKLHEVSTSTLEHLRQDQQVKPLLEPLQPLLGLIQREQQDATQVYRIQASPETMQSVKALLADPINQMQASVNRQQIQNQLKQVGIAMHNWHDNYSVFPAHANYSKEGKPLLSWRVHILPWVGQSPLYSEFHLNEPWDSDHNKKLIDRMPDVFKTNDALAKVGKTGFVFPILPDGSALTTGTKDGIQIQEILDGTSNTAMVVIADDEHSVIWTKPDDLVIDSASPLAGLRIQDNVFQAVFADGAAHSMPATIAPNVWLEFLTRAGKEPAQWPK